MGSGGPTATPKYTAGPGGDANGRPGAGNSAFGGRAARQSRADPHDPRRWADRLFTRAARIRPAFGAWAAPGADSARVAAIAGALVAGLAAGRGGYQAKACSRPK